MRRRGGYLLVMKPIVLSLVAALAASPVLAQEREAEDLMRRGLDLFLEGMQDELSPSLRALADLAAEAGPALQAFLEEMGPALADVLAQVQDWSAYHPPEVLPNGDIIIRRKPSVPRGDEGLPEPDEGQIDL